MKSQAIDWISVCEVAPFGMIITDTQFKIKHLNKTFLALLGFDGISQLKDRQLQDFCDINTLFIDKEFKSSSQFTEPYELNFFNKTGTTTSALAYSFPVKVNNKDHYLAWIMADVSNYKKTGELLKSRLVESEAANSSKTFFMANTSHGIRSHLNSIIGLYQLVKDKTANYEVPREIDQFIKGIEFSSEQLQLLVNSILDLTAIEKGQLSVIQPSAFQVEQLMQSIFELFKDKATEKSLWFTFEIVESTPKYIRADRRILAQILTNLLDNAIKFTKKGNAVKLSVSTANQQVIFKVSDEGIGIEKHLQSFIFNLYEHVRSSENEGEQGTGLGLTIVKRLTELIEGEISVTSKAGEGSTFTLKFPLYEAQAQPIGEDLSAKSLTRFSKENRILIIEDDKMNNEVYQAWFEDFDFEVFFVDNGEDGLELAKAIKFDLIITDIHLPGIDGIEAIGRLRKIPFHKKTPIVVISASTFTDKRGLAFEAGCNDYFVKPLEMNKLIKLLEKYLKGVPKDKQIEFIYPAFEQITQSTKKELLEHYNYLTASSIVHLEKIVDKISEIKVIFTELGYDGPSFLDLVETAAFEGDEKKVRTLTNQAITYYYNESGINQPI